MVYFKNFSLLLVLINFKHFCNFFRVYMSRGSQDLLTMWTPFGDIPVNMGVLAVCEGSHKDERYRDISGRLFFLLILFSYYL